MIRPLGNYIVIEAKKIESVSDGGIILQGDTVGKEQAVEQTGKVVAIGPTAFKRWKGCESPKWLEMATKEYMRLVKEHGANSCRGMFEAICDHWKWEDPDYPPHRQWGLEIGDVVEHRKFNAMDSVTSGDIICRYIPDIEMLGVIRDE
jgi:co-chaperonin GroES (HSP10)